MAEDVSDKTVRALNLWATRIAQARVRRQQWMERFQVERLEAYILGEQHEGSVHPTPLLDSDLWGSEPPVFNHTLAALNAGKSNMLYTHPTFLVRPKPGRQAKGAPADLHAPLAEAVLKAIAEQDDNLKNASRLGLQQAYTRLGVLKVIYDPRRRPNPRAGEVVWETDPEGKPVIAADGMGTPMHDPQTGEVLREPDEITSDETYRWDWVDAGTMLLPDEGPDRSKWTWLGEEVTVELEDARADERFPESLRRQLIATHTQHAHEGRGVPTRDSATGIDPEDDSALLTYVELYDIKHQKFLVYAEGQPFSHMAFLLDDDLPPGVEDHPYALLLGWTPILGPKASAWPLPHIYNWLSPQREYNLRRQQISEACKRSARKGYYEEQTFPDEDEAVKALKSSDDMTFVKITDLERPPQIFADPSITGDIYRDLALLQSDWRVITGQTGARLADPSGDTATEVAAAERSANLRDVDQREIVNDWLAEAGQKMLQRLKATMTLGMVVKMRGFNSQEFKTYIERVYGPETAEMLALLPGLRQAWMERFGEERWQRVTHEELQFEADVQVVPGSARARTLDAERQQMLSFLQILGQAPQLAMSRELLRMVASTFDMVDERMIDEISAMAERMMQANQVQAGRTQGGTGSGAGGTNGATNNPMVNRGGSPLVASQLAQAFGLGGAGR